MVRGEKLDLKPVIPQRTKTVKIDGRTSVRIEKPKSRDLVFPISAEFMSQYIEAFFPAKERRRIKTIVIGNYIPDTYCEKQKCLGEYVPDTTLYLYYTTLNPDGTYSDMHLTREEYTNKVLYDVIPHEIGHKSDCHRYTSRSGRECVPSDRAERAAMARARAFRKQYHIPERWYYLTNKNPNGYIGNAHYLKSAYPSLTQAL